MMNGLAIPGAKSGRWRPVNDILHDAGLTPDQPVRLDNWLLPEEAARLKALRDSQFFLVRNDGEATGERYRCAPREAAERALKLARLSGDPFEIQEAYETWQNAPEGCGRKHAYFTLMCIDQPFRGLDKALYALATVREDPQMTRDILEWAPDLAVGHPETARLWRPELPGQDLLGIALGYAQPISQARAESFAALIQAARPPRPFVL